MTEQVATGSKGEAHQESLDQRSTYRVALLGASGRLGREVSSLLSRDEEARAHGETEAHPSLQLACALGRRDDLHDPKVRSALETCDVLIDVSLPSATDGLLKALSALKRPLPIVSGVTGLSEAQRHALIKYSERAPVFYARNFSLGVALLTHLTALSARVLGGAFDTEVFELHHRQKIDAPSGTARQLAEAAATELRGETSDQPTTTPRDPQLVHMSAGRGGQVVGEHTVFFLGEAERLELTHRASNRALFAHGALRATSWLLSQRELQREPHPFQGRLIGMEALIEGLLAPSQSSSHSAPFNEGRG